MFVISGCPRSGTSLMMRIMVETFGEDRILGDEFPQKKRLNAFKKKSDQETQAQFDLRMYTYERDGKPYDEEFKETKDMNPNGFWEHLYTVQGAYYRFQDSDNLEAIKDAPVDETPICKIVSQGLVNSDPQYINKIVYMVRNPRAVAKSQERLKRNTPFGREADKFFKDKANKIHTPEMFIKVTSMASAWLSKYQDIPVLFVNYDDLIDKPEETLATVQEFLGQGDFTEGAKIIDKKLRRSEPEEVENELWDEAEIVYDLLQNKKFDEIVSYVSSGDRKVNRQNRRWKCFRSGRQVNKHECEQCMENAITMRNYKNFAEKKGINWQNEPCMYECGMDHGDTPLTVDESINQNFWIEEV